MALSSFKQAFGAVFAALLLSQAVADPLMTSLAQVATKEVVKNWIQSRARRSLTEELAVTAKSLGRELSLGAYSTLMTLALSPLFLPIWLPLMLLGSAFFLTTLAPTVLPALVRNLTPTLNHLTLVLSSLGLDGAARSLEPKELSKILQPGQLIERSLDVLDVQEGTCRRKMFCEIGLYTLDKQPAVARFMDLFSDTFSRALPSYSDPLIRGIRGKDCSKIFEECGISPFGKLLNYYFV